VLTALYRHGSDPKSSVSEVVFAIALMLLAQEKAVDGAAAARAVGLFGAVLRVRSQLRLRARVVLPVYTLLSAECD
jgi:hypothetical protein